MPVIEILWEGLSNALLMAWAVWWALVLGFAISAIVQAWVPRERIERAMGRSGARPVGLATALGAASSSCSYAAIAIARSLFAKGASAASSLAFQFASTNLVLELGIVIWVLLGWQFTVAELTGGLILIALMTLLLRLFVSPRLERGARAHAQRAHAGHQHHSAGHPMSLRARLTSSAAWSDVAHNFRNDWAMLYREILLGFMLAGFVGLLGNRFFASLFLVHAPSGPRLLENVLVGPLIAVASFVCSVGNIPLAAVLWSGGIGFAGVIAFIFADLIVVPIVLAYRKFYGGEYAWRIVALMYVTIVLAALIVAGLFSAAHLIPTTRPSRADIFKPIAPDYRLVTNLLGLALFATLFALTIRRGATDPVCGMHVDRADAIVRERHGRRYYLCSQACAARFDAAHTEENPQSPAACTAASPAHSP
ncbi:MAG TPA: permease [Solirubrobacteraceae bacterium]|nr:permease [Solirubrobacteraceae bacterium]